MVSEYVLAAVVVIQLGFIAWLNHAFDKTVKDLTAKIMARDLPEYVRVTKELNKPEEPKQEKRKRVVDPVLGVQF